MPNSFLDEDVTRLRIALARISRVIDRQSSDDGLTRTQLSVLGTVVRLKSVGISDLADIEGLNPTMLSRVVGKLAVRGLVSRAPTADDRRAARVEATQAGRALQLRLRRQRSQLIVARLTELPAGRAEELLAALPALEALAEQMRQPAGQARQPTGQRLPADAASTQPAKPVGAGR